MDAIFRRRFVKAGMKNHAGGAEDMVVRMAELMGLLNRALRTANEILLLIGLDPKMRWKIGNIRKHGDEWAAWKSTMKTLA